MIEERKKQIELLAPAGNMEKLEIAINYGADAVYLAGKNFNLRNFSENFTLENMRKARQLTSKNNIKMYVAINTYSRNEEKKEITKYLLELGLIKPDSLIIADPAIFVQARQLIPEIPIHISTQSNITNTSAASFWKKLGAKRVNTARELSIEEIKEISFNCNIEVETFVHGAMCMAYSGRCLMSNFINQRESNQGRCSQPCRFNYTVMEAKNPGEYFPVYEDNNGSYIFSSKDLCMIDHIDILVKAGVTSLKIEGRMKSINYVATTTKVYREAIDTYYNNKSNYNLFLKHWHNQLNKINNRGYCTGFFLKNSNQNISVLSKGVDTSNEFIAKVLKKTSEGKTLINVRNKLFIGNCVEIISPGEIALKKDIIKEITDETGINHEFAQPGSNVYIKINTTCKELDLIRKSNNFNKKE